MPCRVVYAGVPGRGACLGFGFPPAHMALAVRQPWLAAFILPHLHHGSEEVQRHAVRLGASAEVDRRCEEDVLGPGGFCALCSIRFASRIWVLPPRKREGVSSYTPLHLPPPERAGPVVLVAILRVPHGTRLVLRFS
jgi:hypothetical protein